MYNMEMTMVRIFFSGILLGTVDNQSVGTEPPNLLSGFGEDTGKITDHSVLEDPVKHPTYSTPFDKVPETKSPFLDPTNMTLHPSLETSIHDPTSNVSHCKAQHSNTMFPKDLFSIEDRRQGWVVLHGFGIIYVFVALLIVCNHFFVPSLGIIMERLDISDDVLGVTFMAAGRSIPWLFVKLIKIPFDDCTFPVDINPVIGSAAFRMLFVIGICALFCGRVLPLSRWPLFRDLLFYMLGFIFAIIFFLDGTAMWWENVILVTFSILYIIFLKYNSQAKQIMKTKLQKNKRVKKVSFVNRCEKNPTQVYIPTGEDDAQGLGDCNEGGNVNTGGCKEFVENKLLEGAKPLSLRWPDTWQKQAVYIFLLPIILPLRLTVPDVRNQKNRKFFVLTYLVSIVWISVFCYLVKWWAHQMDEAFGAMGPMTYLVAAMSSPDLITSVIVARKGLGDMVVSSNVGSNIFDINISLAVELLLYTFTHGLSPVAVETRGLVCASILLFLVLLFTVISIMLCKWKMRKLLGLILVFLYVLFVVISIMMVFGIIKCPV